MEEQRTFASRGGAGDFQYKISVCIPTYKPKSYLDRALRSAAAQLSIGNEAEIIILENPSQNSLTPELVNQYKAQGIKYIKHATNLGLRGNWNACIDVAKGEYLHILHDDDWVLPGFYNQMIEALDSHPQVSGAVCRVFFVDEDDEIEGLTARIRQLENGSYTPSPIVNGSNEIQCPGVVARRSFYLQHGGFTDSYLYGIDLEMWARMCQKGGLMTVNKPLAAYRIHQKNTTARLKSTSQDLLDYLLFAEFAMNEIDGFEPDYLLRSVYITAQHRLLLEGNNLDEEHRRKLQIIIGSMNEPFWRLPRIKPVVRAILGLLGISRYRPDTFNCLAAKKNFRGLLAKLEKESIKTGAESKGENL